MDKSIANHDYKAFLKLLVETRRNANVTQVELAEMLETDQSTVSKMERGERRLDVIELRTICSHIKEPFVDFVAKLEKRLKPKKKAKRIRKRR